MKTTPINEFSVLDYGRPTLCVAGLEDTPSDEPALTKADELDLDDEKIRTVEGLLLAAQTHAEVDEQIWNHIDRLRGTLQRKLKPLKRPLGRRALANRSRWAKELERLPKSAGEEVEPWLRCLSPAAFAELHQALENWLYEEPDAPLDGVREALDFFEALPAEQLEILGVSVVSGEHPGSDYYAAELDSTVEEANRAAKKAGIPVRFYYG